MPLPFRREGSVTPPLKFEISWQCYPPNNGLKPNCSLGNFDHRLKNFEGWG